MPKEMKDLSKSTSNLAEKMKIKKKKKPKSASKQSLIGSEAGDLDSVQELDEDLELDEDELKEVE